MDKLEKLHEENLHVPDKEERCPECDGKIIREKHISKNGFYYEIIRCTECNWIYDN